MLENLQLFTQSSIRYNTNDGKVIYFDPFQMSYAPQDADYIFITHSHYDHFSPDDINKVRKSSTKIIITNDLLEKSLTLRIQ